MSQRPLLAVDVDGVISLFGFDEPPDRNVASFELIDGMVHCISRAAGEVTYAPVAADQGRTATDPLAALAKVPAAA